MVVIVAREKQKAQDIIERLLRELSNSTIRLKGEDKMMTSQTTGLLDIIKEGRSGELLPAQWRAVMSQNVDLFSVTPSLSIPGGKTITKEPVTFYDDLLPAEIIAILKAAGRV